jgi:23S rRNA-/tRNA-specific pseudouridylate synthase
MWFQNYLDCSFGLLCLQFATTYQQVDWQRGKPSLTRFRVIGREGNYTRVEFVPLTGRTHQIRFTLLIPKDWM